MTTTIKDIENFAGNSNILKLKVFIETFGDLVGIPDTYYVDFYFPDIPRNVSLDLLSMKVQNLHITIDYDGVIMSEGVYRSLNIIPLSFLETDQYITAGTYVLSENALKTNNRARCWLENTNFLLWAVRNKVNEYNTYSEKLSWVLFKLDIRDEEDLKTIPEQFKQIRLDLPQIGNNEYLAKTIFFDDDFLLWAIRSFLNTNKIDDMPF
ncbi:MAG: hypothetical protein IKO56_02570 [Alphaproteobacteria bacterium]|nr:hypothetical protein [Alphaproteobacteria bacterium]